MQEVTVMLVEVLIAMNINSTCTNISTTPKYVGKRKDAAKCVWSAIKTCDQTTNTNTNTVVVVVVVAAAAAAAAAHTYHS